MGVIKLFSSCSDYSHQEQAFREITPRYCHGNKGGQKTRVIGNPDPLNFQILQYEEIEHFVIVLVRYPECSNFEGRKILVFGNVSAETIKNLDSIDPHFCNSDAHLSPVARFVPTHTGWEYAVQFCETQRRRR